MLISPTLSRPADAAPNKDGRAGDQHRAGQELGQHRAEGRIPACGGEVAGLKLFVDHRRLLVEDHPRVEGRADDRGDQVHEFAIADR